MTVKNGHKHHSVHTRFQVTSQLKSLKSLKNSPSDMKIFLIFLDPIPVYTVHQCNYFSTTKTHKKVSLYFLYQNMITFSPCQKK